MSIVDFLLRLKEVKGRDGQWTARCPAHEDDRPSLSITRGADNEPIVNCHAGCTWQSIFAAVGYSRTLGATESGSLRSARRESAVYPYRDEHGDVAYEVVRYEPKDFRVRRPRPEGGYEWNLRGIARVPFRLPDLVRAAKAGETIYIVEGEKDALTLAKYGLLATTNAGGAGKWEPAWATYFAGATVVILPDNDVPGREHADAVLASLQATAGRVRIIELPDLPPKGDVSDWLTLGHSIDELRSLARATANEEPTVAEAGRTLKTGARRLSEWLTEVHLLTQPRTLLPHLVVEGRVTLLSGREKIGKSTLVAAAVAAASQGALVLGDPLERRVTTLWYSLDEHVSDTVRRFERLAADPARIIVNREPRQLADVLAALAADLEQFAPIDLVVVDTLSRILSASGVDPNSSREVEPLMTQLVDLCHARDVAAILLYHTGKSGIEYRGSTAFGATVDDILTLRRRGEKADDDFDDDGKDDGQRILVQDGRNLRGRLRLQQQNGQYVRFEASASVRERILRVLTAEQPIRTKSDLVRRAGGRREEALQVVDALLREGRIVKGGTGLTLAADVPEGQTRMQPVGDGYDPGFPVPKSSALGNPTGTSSGLADGLSGAAVPDSVEGRDEIGNPGAGPPVPEAAVG